MRLQMTQRFAKRATKWKMMRGAREKSICCADAYRRIFVRVWIQSFGFDHYRQIQIVDEMGLVIWSVTARPKKVVATC
jgi:hypothetical protein